MLSNYEAAQLHMEKARNITKGRPMKGTGWRLFQDGDEYVVNVHGHQLGRFLPDNTFMFTIERDVTYTLAPVLSATMHRNLPFRWCRVGKMKYRVEHLHGMITPPHEHFQGKNKSPLVYAGLKFDLTTGKCLNYKPDPTKQIDPERRKVWLAARRAWKNKLKVATRLGVLDNLLAEERRSRTPWDKVPRWANKYELDILYKAIKDNDLNTDLLRMFVASETSWACKETPMDICESVGKLLDAHSIELRYRFGVFLEMNDG